MQERNRTLGDILYEARTRLNLTVNHVAAAAGVASNTIRSWENNEKSPMVSNLMRVCNILGISIVIESTGEVRLK